MTAHLCCGRTRGHADFCKHQTSQTSQTRLSPADRRIIDASIRHGDLVMAARWMVDVWADNEAIEQGSALWEDIQRVKRAVDALRR